MDSVPAVIEEGLATETMRIEVERNGETAFLEVGTAFRLDEDAQVVQVAHDLTRTETLDW